jgi:hypothetical protein
MRWLCGRKVVESIGRIAVIDGRYPIVSLPKPTNTREK